MFLYGISKYKKEIISSIVCLQGNLLTSMLVDPNFNFKFYKTSEYCFLKQSC